MLHVRRNPGGWSCLGAAYRLTVVAVWLAGALTGCAEPGATGAPDGAGGQTGAGGTTMAGTGGAMAGVGGQTGGNPTPDGGGAGGSSADGGGADARGNDTGPSTGAGGAAGTAGGSGGRAGTGGGGGGAPPVGPNPDAATRARCTGVDPIECHFGGAPGNYDVTVVLGGAAAGRTLVQAERFRTMLAPVATAAAQTQRFTFTVNVRQPEAEPIQPASANVGTPGLDVYFLGQDGMPPQLQSIGFQAAASPFMIYVGGDSTVCDQPTLDYGGWAQQIPQHFNYPVSIANYADSGESSGSFLGSGSLFGAIETRLRAGDWVLLQFGHNDKTNTAANFHDNLTAMVTRTKAKGAFPVLITPVARALFNGSTVAPQHINDTGANLPEITKQVADEQRVPVLDLTARTVQWLMMLGPNGWQQYHALGTDATHTNPAGANIEAGFVRDLVRGANLTALTALMR
jgi:lysophospholipase L1-like esterase